MMYNCIHRFRVLSRVRLRGPLVLVALLLFGVNTTSAQSLEYRVKAGFLFNFAKFVDWPSGLLTETEPLRIGIWAPDVSFEVMADVLDGKQIADRQISVTRFDENGPPPHILFVHNNEEPIPAPLLAKLAEAHVLVVGESPDFASRYGIIGLVPRGDSLRFQVNLGAAKRANLNLSGQLARLAEIVRDDS